MRNLILVVGLIFGVLFVAPLPASAQPVEDAQSPASTQPTPKAKPDAEAARESAKVQPPSPVGFHDALRQFPRMLANVQVELTISDQTGSRTPEKKTVSMIVGNSAWGKIRASAAAIERERDGIVPVGLNVDARPFVSGDGLIQLELTLVYNPLGVRSNDSTPPDGSRQVRPTELNQSLTVVLQSGKPLVISQAADPVGDRKIFVEVKATVLK